MGFFSFIVLLAIAYLVWRVTDQLPDLIFRLSEIQRDVAEIRRRLIEQNAGDITNPNPGTPRPGTTDPRTTGSSTTGGSAAGPGTTSPGTSGGTSGQPGEGGVHGGETGADYTRS